MLFDLYIHSPRHKGKQQKEEESREKRNRASLLANLSLALLRGNEKKEALEAAIACEEEDAQWHKGSYRKAETLYALGEFKEAAEAYESAKVKILDYKTEEKNVDAAINELDGKIHASKEKMEELEELKSIDKELLLHLLHNVHKFHQYIF